jgi:hypothetical protein
MGRMRSSGICPAVRVSGNLCASCGGRVYAQLAEAFRDDAGIPRNRVIAMRLLNLKTPLLFGVARPG